MGGWERTVERLALAELFGGAFRGKRVLVTGHTGFKGSWLSLWLGELGATVTGYALDPPTTPSNFDTSKVITCLVRHVIADVRDAETLTKVVCEADPDVIFHLAAQALSALLDQGNHVCWRWHEWSLVSKPK